MMKTPERSPTTAAPHAAAPWNARRRDLPGDGGFYFRIFPCGGRDALAPTFACGSQETNARLIAASPELLQEGQALYDAIQYSLIDVPDTGLPPYLTAAFDRWESVAN